jgi:hypothetical protein
MAINGQAKASQQLNNIFGNGLNQRNAAAAVDTITTNQSQSTSQQTPEGPTLYKPLVITTDDNGNPLPSTDTLASTPLSITQDEEGNPLPPTAPSNTEPAAAAPTDDNFGLANTTSGTAAQLNVGTNPGGLMKPQLNILDQYASYTYNLGWYLLSPTQFAEITNATKLDVTKWSLLVQSGGAAVQQAGVSQQGTPTDQLTSSAISGRNKYFSLDYYIDDLEISTTLGGGGPATLTELSFKVTEPNGLTLLPNLTNAVRDLYQETNAANNLAFYVIVVKFYGWDINGNLITDPNSNKGVAGATPGISNSVITRYYPFQITEFNFKMASKAIEYQIKGVPQHFQYASSSGTGSIPYNIELTGETVKDILSGTGINVTNGVSIEGGREDTITDAPSVVTSPITLAPQSDNAEVAALFNDGTGYAPGYDPNAGWSA